MCKHVAGRFSHFVCGSAPCNSFPLSLLQLLWAPLRSNGTDYVLPTVSFFHSKRMLKNYPTDLHQIFRN